MTTPESWGTVLAFMGDLYNGDQITEFPIDLTADSVIEFSIATTGDYDSLEVIIPGADGGEDKIALDSLDIQSTNWQRVEISADQLSSVGPSKVSQIAIVAYGGTTGTSKVYITDYKVTNYKVAN